MIIARLDNATIQQINKLENLIIKLNNYKNYIHQLENTTCRLIIFQLNSQDGSSYYKAIEQSKFCKTNLPSRASL